MKRKVQVGEKSHLVELMTDTAGASIRVDGSVLAADFAEIRPGLYSVLWEGRSYEIRIEPTSSTPQGAAGASTAASDGLRVHVCVAQPGGLGLDTHEFLVQVHDPRRLRRRETSSIEAAGRQKVAAPMPGRVVRVLVEEGEGVEEGQGLLVVEAMKMQNEIQSPKKGMVEKVLARAGQAVNAGETLVIVA